MRMVRVRSANLMSVGYDPSVRELRIHFVAGPTYAYAEVPAETYAALLVAESHGKFFHQNVRGKFTYRRIA